MKSSIWQSLGMTVAIVDPKISVPVQDDYIDASQIPASKEVIVDIATPAGHHVSTLLEAHSRFGDSIQKVIIEKPLASSQSELDILKSYVNKNKNLQLNMFVNESYFVSSALEFVKNRISKSDENILSIFIRLDKNRILDNKHGRFFDESLESLGIEVPHIIAIVEFLAGENINSSDLNSTIYRNGNDSKNQTVVLSGKTKNGIGLDLQSSLGDFRVEDENIIEGNDIRRIVNIQTNKTLYSIHFDPVPGLNRQKSLIEIAPNTEDKVEEKVVDDNHLVRLTKLVAKGKLNEQLKSNIGLDNALRICEILLTLKQVSRQINITTRNGR